MTDLFILISHFGCIVNIFGSLSLLYQIPPLRLQERRERDDLQPESDLGQDIGGEGVGQVAAELGQRQPQGHR